MIPYYSKDGIVIYHGDCREVLPGLAFDLIFTDPPWGVGLGSVPRSEKMAKHGNGGYLTIDDTPEYVSTVVVPVVALCRDRGARVVLTPGSRCMFRYPAPDATWCIHYPNGAGIGKWKAFTCWQPILCYGAPPGTPGVWPDTFTTTEQAEVNGHPCPKPIGLWRSILMRVAGAVDVVCDPFMGSGTTLVAARDLGRKAIGIEIEERYCEIAAKRLDQALLPFEEADRIAAKSREIG